MAVPIDMVGTLWYEPNPKKSLDDRVREVANFHRAKYNVEPNRCFVNPAHLPDGKERVVHGILVVPNKTTLPNHLWCGRLENNKG